MKRVGLLLVALLFSSMPVAAQEPVQVLDDGAGDVSLDVAGTPQTPPAGLADHVDLRGASIQEDADGFLFSIDVADTNGAGGGQFSYTGYARMYFLHEDMVFRVQFEYCFFCMPAPNIGSRLDAVPAEGGEWSQLARAFGNEVNVEGNTMSWWLPRDLFADQKGAAPFPGRSFTEIWAESGFGTNEFRLGDPNDPNTQQFPIYVADRMPDDGVSPMAVPIEFGLAQSGDAKVTSEEPFRASNGEATTFLYRLNATNLGAESQIFQFGATGVPAAWEVTFPVPTVVLEGGESQEIPVLLNTPFAHQHGGAQSFVVEMIAPQAPANVGRVELGIRFLEIPQPAGHHDTVFFHAAEFEVDNPVAQAFVTAFAGTGYQWMNAEPDDELAQGSDISARSTFLGNEVTHWWLLPLSPALRLGIDGDLDGTGAISFALQAQAPQPAAVVTATLALVGPEVEVERGQAQSEQQPYIFPFGRRMVEPLAIVSWDPVEYSIGTRQTYEADFDLLPFADYIRYDATNNLVLAIEMASARPPTLFAEQSVAPVMVGGGQMTLPLFEYHDPVDDAFSALSGPTLEVQGDPARLVNPGGLLLYNVAIADQGNAAGDYDLEITGLNPDWASILGPSRISLEGDTQMVTVQVEVPETAKAGDRIDVFLQAIHRDDDTRRGLARLVADIDTASEHEDDRLQAEALTPTEEAPAVSPLLLAAILLLGLIRRLRHNG